MPLTSKHLLGLDGMSRDDMKLILDTAVSFREVLERPIKKVPPLQGKTVANMFFENSTRTRLSFELAERRLSADVLGFQATGSSVSKGETLKDTARNIEAMKVDMVVMRHSAAGARRLQRFAFRTFQSLEPGRPRPALCPRKTFYMTMVSHSIHPPNAASSAATFPYTSAAWCVPPSRLYCSRKLATGVAGVNQP